MKDKNEINSSKACEKQLDKEIVNELYPNVEDLEKKKEKVTNLRIDDVLNERIKISEEKAEHYSTESNNSLNNSDGSFNKTIVGPHRSKLSQHDLKIARFQALEHHEHENLLKDENNNNKPVVGRKNTRYKYTKISNFVLRLSRFYALMPFWKLGLITAGLAILFGIVGIFLVKNPGIYNFGLAAFGQATSKITMTFLRKFPEISKPVYNAIDQSMFWILYLVLSIPIFWFGWVKLGRNYTVLTLEFLVISSFVSAGLGQIPALTSWTLFGTFNHPEITAEIKNAVATVNNWSDGSKAHLLSLLPLQWNYGGPIIAQIIYAVVYGILLAYFFAAIAIIGGSAGVTGIIGEYVSVYKQKNFGTINGYINLIIIFVSVIIGNYVPGSIIAGDFKNTVDSYAYNNLSLTDQETIRTIAKLQWNTELYFSPNFVSTFICNFAFVAYLDKLFPRFKIVQCKVYTHNMDAIKEAIISDEKTINSFTIQKGEGGYSGSKLKVLSSITLYRQVPRLIKKIREVDDEALITVSDVASVDGKIYIPRDKF
ncbi:DUF2179 domain-containing protein [Mycoplasmopsis felifaucium]|uniref:DUF2179 domain-containing protein n=1 Tax=Mycoplasmopsis felifaucium TaxID=35768 RepID=UPI0009FBA5A0|nr:DUF2179 domain-containing protein [Mycoplasmopsis felifaucium]